MAGNWGAAEGQDVHHSVPKRPPCRRNYQQPRPPYGSPRAISWPSSSTGSHSRSIGLLDFVSRPIPTHARSVNTYQLWWIMKSKCTAASPASTAVKLIIVASRWTPSVGYVAHTTTVAPSERKAVASFNKGFADCQCCKNRDSAECRKTPAPPSQTGQGAVGLRATGSFLPPRSPPMSSTISLDTRCAQTAKTILVDQLLPGTKFIDGQRVAAARLLERKQTTANRSNNLGFTTRHPTFRSRWWQIGDRQRRTDRPDHVVAWWARRLSHGRRYRSIQSALGRYAGPRKARPQFHQR